MSSERISRLLRLITLLESGRMTRAIDLQTELGISRRTLFRDLKAIQAAGVPYYHERGKGYRIARTFYLPPMNLTVSETLGLLLLGKNAAASRNNPMSGHALSAVSKLITTLPEPIRQACDDIMRHVTITPAPKVESNAESRHYPTLQTCIDKMHACVMHYQGPLEDKPTILRFEPYALHFASRAWYVFGNTDRYDSVRMFKLSRIRKLDPTAAPFRRPAHFRVADHLGNAWSLIPEGKTYKIQLIFSAKVTTNVSEVLWHPTQKFTRLSDDRLRMNIEVDGLNEIAWWICSYAGEVRVEKPAALRHRVEQMHQAAIAPPPAPPPPPPSSPHAST